MDVRKRNYQNTNKRLLKSGLKLFLKYNFEVTSVRKICKDAGVTTGAFYKHFNTKADLLNEIVNPHFKNIQNIYTEQFAHFTTLNEITQFYSKSDWIKPFIEYIYSNRKVSTLLLFKAAGSKYVDLLEHLTLFMQEKMIKFIQLAQQKKIINNQTKFEVSDIHFFIYSFYGTVYDILKHEYPLAKTQKLIDHLYKFFVSAWRNYLQNNQ